MEGVGIEAMPLDGGSDDGLTTGAWKSDVDHRRDLVGQAVASERRSKAQRGLRSPGRDLQQVAIPGGISLAEQAPAQALDDARVPKPGELAV